MSVLIRGMDMPSECRECPLCQYYMAVGETRCRRTGEVLASGFGTIKFSGRSEHCQLVELPEKHGRLIDESIVLEMIRKSMGIKDLSFLYHAEKSVVNEIYHAPTVIDAEDEEQ